MKQEHANLRWGYLTQAEVQAKADACRTEDYIHAGFSEGPYKPAYLDLTGKKYSFVFENGTVFSYEFSGLHELVWSDGKETHTDYAEVLPSRDGVIFINHFVKGSNPPEAHMIVFDTGNGLVTACVAKICNPYNPREVVREFLFGLEEGYADPGYRHDYTDEMVGNTICWTYDGEFSIKHIYIHPAFYTYVMEPYPGGGSWVASNPANYIKIRDGLYIFTFVEERQTGTQGFFLMDLQELHDVGSFFGMPGALMECYTFGAVGQFGEPYTK